MCAFPLTKFESKVLFGHEQTTNRSIVFSEDIYKYPDNMKVSRRQDEFRSSSVFFGSRELVICL